MKPTIKKSTLLNMLLGLSISLLFSCKKENKEVDLQPLNEEAIDIKPMLAESPELGKKVEETGFLPFPNKPFESASATTIGTTDYVDFDDEMALTILPGYAANTFAYEPFYIQQVGSAWVHVKENNSGNYKPAFMSHYGHFHLSYQNFQPCFINGQFGKPVQGGCASINPVKEPRILNTHDGDHWIKIYAYDYSSPSRVFDLLGIKVTTGPIQLWFKKSNGDWHHWSSIGVGAWNLSAHSTSIKEALISSTGNSGSIGFDNVKVKVPDF
jgi:hypothetical protein